MCEALLMVGAWNNACSILDRLPQFAAVSHPPIAKGLCKLIHTTIEPLYRRWVKNYLGYGSSLVCLIVYHMQGKVTECLLAETEGIFFFNHEGTLPSSLCDSGMFEKTLKICMKLILNCLRAHVIIYKNQTIKFPCNFS